MKQVDLKAFIRLLEYLDFHKDGDTYAKIINGVKTGVARDNLWELYLYT